MRKRKLAGIAMSFLLTAGVMAGCSSQSSSDGGDSKTVKVGVNLELSGNVASYGQSLAEGLELGVKEINKKGIDGKRSRLSRLIINQMQLKQLVQHLN